MVNMQDIDELLTVQEAATEKGGGLTRGGVLKAIKRGALPFVEIRGHLFVKRQDLAAWSPELDRKARASKAAKARWDKEKE